ncbi:hypothetical protein N8261_04795 [Flavobacteriaceae bacterium]|nr:hypothetical protein [Flavobacteriaceae bacterium]
MDTNVFNIINKLYSKAGFLEKYGGSLWVSIIIAIILFLAISYYQVLNNLQPIKADWINQRCSPSVMPFAGIINPPNPNEMSAFEYTSSNFSNCIQTILQDIVGVFLAPFYYLVKVLSETINIADEAVQSIRGMADKMRTAVSSVSSEIMGRLLNILIPLQAIIMKVKDTVNKTQGIMTGSIFTLFGIYDTLRAAIGAIVEIIVTILIGLASIIVVLFVIPFGLGLPFAIPLLAIFLIILIPGILVYIIEVMILKKMVSPLPGIPGCFIGDTLIELNNGSHIAMKDLEIGMILQNNNSVTSTMKMACSDDIYNLHNVLCTGNHAVKYNNAWISVKNHPDSIVTCEQHDIVYCINTENKTIVLNNIIFGDYDEMDSSEIDEIKYKCSKYLPKQFELKHIHEYLDGGFKGDTQIELLDGHSVNIQDVCVNDVLRFGERVAGIVKIKANDLNTKIYHLENNQIVFGGPNLQICDTDLGMINTLDIHAEKIKINDIYHLITNKKTFHVCGIKFCDYNSCIDKFLHLKHKSLVKSLI